MRASPQYSNRYTAARYLKSIAIARGSLAGAIGFAEGQGHWADRPEVVTALKAAVAALGTADYMAAPMRPVSESFLHTMRGTSVPMRLTGMQAVPMFERIFVNNAVAVAARVAEGAAIPVMKGNWTGTVLKPVKHGAIDVVTKELVQSASHAAEAALLDDLARAVAEAENESFVSRDQAGRVLSTATSPFTATGSAVANVDADLRRLVDQVAGASNPGASFVMCKETATFLSLLRGSGGGAAYPAITPQGGTLLGMQVLITAACEVSGSPVSRVIGLIDPSSIFWADEGRVELGLSDETSLQQDSTPTQHSLTPTPTNLVSMFQTEAVALKAARYSAWYARAGASSYFVAGY
jgi:hypothetical protein